MFKSSTEFSGANVLRYSPLIQIGRWLAVSMVLAGCASDALRQTEADIDVIAATIAKAPEPPGADIVDWASLLDVARRRGPAFIDIRLTEAQARLDIDERRSGRRPRLNAALGARILAAAQGQSPVVDSSAGLGVQYDLAAALIALDEESIALSEALIPLRRQLAERSAESELLEAYFLHANRALDLRSERLNQRQMGCREEALSVEIALGQTPSASLEALRRRREAQRHAIALLEAEVEASADRAFSTAGMQPGARLSPQPVPVTTPDPSNVSVSACYEASGGDERDHLMQQLARRALDRARLSRWTQVTATLPARLDPSTGLDFDLLIQWVIPLIDQGDALREVQRARIELLAIALTAERERLSHKQAISRALRQLTLARVEAIGLDETPQGLAETPMRDVPRSQQCERDLTEERKQIERLRGALAINEAEAALSVLCRAASDRD